MRRQKWWGHVTWKDDDRILVQKLIQVQKLIHEPENYWFKTDQGENKM